MGGSNRRQRSRGQWEDRVVELVRAMELERRRSRVPWIFLVYHAVPREPGAEPPDADSCEPAGDAEAALYRGDPLPTGLAFERGQIRRLSDEELKAVEDEQKAAAKRLAAFGGADTETTGPGTIVVGGGNAV